MKSLVLALAVVGLGHAPAEASTIGQSRPVVVVGTILENRGDGAEIVIGDVTDGTENALRVYAARGRVTFGSVDTEARDGTYSWTVGLDCSSEFEPQVCVPGAQVDVLGHVVDSGPVAGSFRADVVRPRSGLGVTRRTSAPVAVVRDRDVPCEYNCGRIDGVVADGEFAGWDVRMDYECVNGFRATWRLSRYGTTLTGTATSFYDPFIGLIESAEELGGQVTGGTKGFVGAAGVASIDPLLEPCSFSPTFTIDIELVPGF